MDDVSFSKKANISSISRFDSEVKDIIISASQVALYLFNSKKSTWNKRKVEGACFFYKRKTRPKYGIFILNRLDTNNFIEHMNSKMEIQLQEPYLLYRNIFKDIYGIWFYDISECTALATVFQRILKELKEKENEDQENDDKNPVVDDRNGHDWNQIPSSQPDSVRQFFAKASKEATKPLAIPQASSAKSLCGSFQSVDHIEKVQKSEPLENSIYNVCGAFDIIGDKGFKNDIVSPVTWKQNLMRKDQHENSVNVIENSMRGISIGPSTMMEDKSTTNVSLDHIASPCPELPELIPPGMLLTPSDLSASFKTTDVSDVEKHVKKNALNKAQMIQAMEYLLKHDSQFTDKLYDAYLKSSRIN